MPRMSLFRLVTVSIAALSASNACFIGHIHPRRSGPPHCHLQGDIFGLWTQRVLFRKYTLLSASRHDLSPLKVLATIYTFKPQNASVSQLFCLIIAYVLGTGMAGEIFRSCYTHATLIFYANDSQD